MSEILTTTARDIVVGALRLIGEIDANQPPENNEFQDGLEALNYLVKSWQAQGLHLWTKTEGILFLDVGKTDYLLGPAGDEATELDDFIGTTLSASGSANDTTLNLTSTVGMAIDDKIGIRLADGTRQWTTILSVTSATVTIPLSGLTGDATLGNTVYTFTDLIPRPVRILQLRRGQTGTTEEIEAEQWSREEYFAQPDKTSQGTINNWYYSPQLSNGRLYIWQVANSADQIARFTYERPIDITDETTDSPDFPSEWFRTLKYNLAVDIAPEYTISQERIDTLTFKAEQMLENSLGFDMEPDSMSMQPDLGRS